MEGHNMKRWALSILAVFVFGIVISCSGEGGRNLNSSSGDSGADSGTDTDTDTDTGTSSAAPCGNDVIDLGEQCDDGNTVTEVCPYGQKSCTVCDSNCHLSLGLTSYCGDTLLDSGHGEQCDDGNTANADACVTGCKNATCGDWYVWVGHEECDDGNTANADACVYGQTSCTTCNGSCQSVAGQASYCGDGATDVANGEECDDGNTIDGDGCV
jgi:cysteine-rich repeat protein